MKTKDKLLELFEHNKGKYLSGEEIANLLNLSRTSVWKAVNKLKEEGYKIEAVTNKGYLLNLDNDIITVNGIKSNLINKDINIEILNEIESTNDYLKSLDPINLNDETLIVSNYQNKGRGRLGKSFYSPKDTGIYLSLLLKPDNWFSSKALSITTMAAVAILEAIEEVSDLKPKIKWVNDIFIDNLKVCGILTEGEFSMETGLLQYAILGLGINIYKPVDGFPEELKTIAGYLLDEQQGDFKNKLIASFINHFNNYYKNPDNNYIDKYRSYSFVIGKVVTVIINGKEEIVKVLGIDDDCRLIIEDQNHNQKSLNYGEIKIKI